MPCPGGDDLYLKEEDFREVYAADVPEAVAAVPAASQQPIDPSALGEPLRGPASWKTVPVAHPDVVDVLAHVG